MITESEKFLNQIEKERLDLTNLKKDFKDLESFLEIYELLKSNLVHYILPQDLCQRAFSPLYMPRSSSRLPSVRGMDYPYCER